MRARPPRLCRRLIRVFISPTSPSPTWLLACRSELRHRRDSSSPSRVEAGPADEAAGGHGHAIDDLERQSRKSSRRRAVQDSRTVFEIELREVARAFDRARRGLPVPAVAG